MQNMNINGVQAVMFRQQFSIAEVQVHTEFPRRLM
jgi:hypothetical protein